MRHATQTGKTFQAYQSKQVLFTCREPNTENHLNGPTKTLLNSHICLTLRCTANYAQVRGNAKLQLCIGPVRNDSKLWLLQPFPRNPLHIYDRCREMSTHQRLKQRYNMQLYSDCPK